MASEPTQVEKRTFGVMFAAIAVMACWTVWPIWIPIFIGALLAAVTWPIKARLNKRFHHPRTLAVILTTIAVAIASTIVVMVGLVAVRELLRVLSEDVSRYAAESLVWFKSPSVARWLSRIGSSPEQVRNTLQSYASSAVSHLSDLLGRLIAITSSGIVMLIFGSLTSYYLLVDGEALAQMIYRLVPIPEEDLRSLMREFYGVAMGTLLGIVVIGIFQGFACGLGFMVAGVSRALFWGTVTGVASLIPSFGTALVAVPIAIVLMVQGHVVAGVALLLYWGFVVVLFSDLVLRPMLMKGYVKLHSLLLLIALFGGLEAFGAIGLLVGPLFVTLFVAMLRIYERNYRPANT